jgi:hypothetical protein
MDRRHAMLAIATALATASAGDAAMAATAALPDKVIESIDAWLQAASVAFWQAYGKQPALTLALAFVALLLPPLALLGGWQRWRSGRRARRAIAARETPESATKLLGRSLGRRPVLHLMASGATSVPGVPQAGGGLGIPIDERRAVIRVGSAEDNEVRLLRPEVARYHAVIRREYDGGLWLVDIEGSETTPIRLNGERIVQSLIVPGDVVEIGSAKLQLVERVASA